MSKRKPPFEVKSVRTTLGERAVGRATEWKVCRVGDTRERAIYSTAGQEKPNAVCEFLNTYVDRNPEAIQEIGGMLNLNLRIPLH